MGLIFGDPATSQRVSAALLGLGSGLLSGNTWGQGLGRGFAAAGAGLQDANDNIRRDALLKLQQQQADETTADRAARLAAYKQQQDAIAQLAATPPAGIDPTLWHNQVMASPEAAAAAGLKRTIPDIPAGYQANGSGLQATPGGPNDPATIDQLERIKARNTWHDLAPGAIGGYGIGAPGGGQGGTPPAATGEPAASSPVFSAAEQKYGLPAGSVAAIASQESGGQGMGARSSAGAIGTMQLMPGTARDMGANPYDTEQNIDAGAGYFAQLLKKYGDVPTALAAYNAGPGRVDGWIKAGRPKTGPMALPPETIDYVPKVLGRMQAGGGQGSAAAAPGGGGGLSVGADGTITNTNPAPGQARWVAAEQDGIKGQLNQTTGEFKPGARGQNQTTVENQIRSDWLQASKEFPVVQSAYLKINAAAKEQSAAGDMAMIYGLMRLLDPNTGVKEGEYATAQQSGSLPTQIVGLYNRALTGQKLTPGQREEFLHTAKGQYDVNRRVYDQLKMSFTGIAQRSNVDPRNVIIDQSLPDQSADQQQSGAPAPAPTADDPLDGRTATGPNGQKIIRKGGQWLPLQ